MLVEEHKGKPILVFMGDLPTGDHVKFVEAAARLHKVEYLKIEDDEALKFESRAATEKETGVFILACKYGRGVDFKLRSDAFVIILMNGELKLRNSNILQMAGRGNRSQGVPTAHVILCKESPKGRNVDAILTTNSNSNVV